MAILAPLPVFVRIGDDGDEVKIGTVTPEVTLREPTGDGTVIAEIHVPAVEFFREFGGRIGLRKVPRRCG
jgi:hypothetical protein